MERLFKNLGKWESENDRAVWNIELAQAGSLPGAAQLLASLTKTPATPGCLEAGDKTLTGRWLDRQQRSL